VGEFYVSVRIPFVLEKIVRANSLEEAKKIAEQLEPEDFDNFHNFYEWLGSNWSQIAEKVTVEEISNH
jgi:hypothetical protein